ncbi:hypothetical protein WBG78_20280 [Chryseolinea sp. T2]|uniref:hypothetical protein n=1 Tax=Chryseolinea sp. T2 TaxID=3129255 RepID=UPI003076F51B
MQPFTIKDGRIAGMLTILSGILAFGSMLTGMIATNFDSEAFSNPVLILRMESATPAMIKWFMLLDMFGYYLLLLPAIFFLHQRTVNRSSWTSLITFSGYGYVIIGAIGAAMLAAAWPSLITSFRQATPADQPLYQELFILSNELVVKGIWNILEMFLAGTWWLGLALLMPGGRWFKGTTLALGAACILDGTGEMFGLATLAEIGLNIYLVLAIVWAIWAGIVMMRPVSVQKQ